MRTVRTLVHCNGLALLNTLTYQHVPFMPAPSTYNHPQNDMTSTPHTH
jgi:hypothetical protein